MMQITKIFTKVEFDVSEMAYTSADECFGYDDEVKTETVLESKRCFIHKRKAETMKRAFTDCNKHGCSFTEHTESFSWKSVNRRDDR